MNNIKLLKKTFSSWLQAYLKLLEMRHHKKHAFLFCKAAFRLWIGNAARLIPRLSCALAVEKVGKQAGVHTSRERISTCVPTKSLAYMSW